MEIEIADEDAETHMEPVAAYLHVPIKGEHVEVLYAIADIPVNMQSEMKVARSKTNHPEHNHTRSSNEIPVSCKLGKSSVKKEILVQPMDHDYLTSHGKPEDSNMLYENIGSFIGEYRVDNSEIYVTHNERTQLAIACAYGDMKNICSVILSIDSLRKCIIGACNITLEQTASEMTNRKYDTSVLMQKSLDDLKSFNWFTVVKEFKERFPDLLAQVLSVMTKKESQMLGPEIERIIPRLGAIYGIMMQGRCQELSLMQRWNSLLLLESICDMKTFERLNKQGVCLSYEGRQYAMEAIGGKFNNA